MMMKTHLMISFALALLLIKYNFLTFFTVGTHGFLIMVLIATLIPDMDHSNSTIGKRIPILPKIIEKVFGRRGMFHSIFGCALSLLIIATILTSLGLGPLLLFAFLFGFVSHLIADSLSLQGVRWFYPISKFRIKGIVKVGGYLEWLLFLIFTVIFGILILNLGLKIFLFI